MKRILSALFSLIFCCAIYAQTEHMKFMGIPLTGTITAFQSKLQAKGAVPNTSLNRQLKVGSRAFTGTFSGEKADIYVYYDEKTKIVYRAKAVITCIDKGNGEGKYASFKAMLQTKYSDGVVEDGEQDGHPSMSIYVPDSNKEAFLGCVDMYISNPPYSFIDEVYLHIDYKDTANMRKNISSNMDDL